MFEFDAGVLTGYILAVAAQRHMLIENIRADYDAARVRARLSRRIFEFHRYVDDPRDFGVFVVHFDQFSDRIVDAEILIRFLWVVFAENLHQDIRTFKVELVALCIFYHHFVGYRLGYSVSLGIGQFKNPCHVFYGVFRRHRAERYDFTYPVVTVFAADVFYYFLSAAILEVYVEIGCRNTLGV